MFNWSPKMQVFLHLSCVYINSRTISQKLPLKTSSPKTRAFRSHDHFFDSHPEIILIIKKKATSVAPREIDHCIRSSVGEGGRLTGSIIPATNSTFLVRDSCCSVNKSCWQLMICMHSPVSARQKQKKKTRPRNINQSGEGNEPRLLLSNFSFQ